RAGRPRGGVLECDVKRRSGVFWRLFSAAWSEPSLMSGSRSSKKARATLHLAFHHTHTPSIIAAKECGLVSVALARRSARKRGERAEIAPDLGIEIRGLTSSPAAPEVEEDGATFEDNARKKAVVLAKALHEWVLGEASGLCVPALDGRPGVYSARYAGTQG